MPRTVKIGGACAFYGDSSMAPTQLMQAGVDYLMLDYLAEATMSVLGRLHAARPDLGYARDFTDWVWKDNLQLIRETGTRIVTNAGGVNPRACVERMRRWADEAGLSFRIAWIEGDDVHALLPGLAQAGTTELYSGAPFPDPEQVATANAYLGATPIARALAMGADVVVTGRVVDSALALGPLVHEFGWTPGDHDRLAAGSLAGHIIECGAQATGGLFTDWEEVPDWTHMGYPIVECGADGTFTVTKPAGTGGLVTCATVAEQIFYEIDDPQIYMLPDVVCDFSRVRLAQDGADRVRVTGVVGYPPTGRYKITITHQDGHRCLAFMPVVGRDAARKAERQARAILDRVNGMLVERGLGPFRAHRIEAIGAEATYGANARARDTREVVCKLGVEHEDPAAFRYLQREWDSPTTSLAVGTTGWFGARAQAVPVMRVFSTTVPREHIGVTVHMDGRDEDVAVPPPERVFDPDAVDRPAPPPEPRAEGDMVKRPLIELAWARSGDKGDAFNVGVIARRPEYLPWIRAALTTDAVRDWFVHEFDDPAKARVERFDAPGLEAVNFHLHDALGGGQFASLRLDPLAKGKAQQLLDFPVAVPAALVTGAGGS